MSKNCVFLMCSPRGEESASYSLGNYLSGLLEEHEVSVKSFHIYKTLRNEDRIYEMIDSINKSDIILLATPLYVDSAPYMTIKTMNEITTAKEDGRIEENKRLLVVISCAGFLEYYHNNLALRIYEQFAKKNGFIWAGGFPIGAAGTYASFPIPKILEMIKTLPEGDYRHHFYGKPAQILDSVFHNAITSILKGEKVSDEELKKLEFIPIPLEAYVNGGNKGWIEWAEQLGSVDKLRDKPYE